MMSRRVYTPTSSNVVYHCYDDEAWVLEIGFKKSGIYFYSHLPPKVWYGLQNASSPGTYVWDVLRRSVPFPYDLQTDYTADYTEAGMVDERLITPEMKKKPAQWWKFWE